MRFFVLLLILMLIVLFSIPVATIDIQYITPRQPLTRRYRPVFGGIQLTNSKHQFTSGYIAWYNGQPGIVTAGHAYFYNGEPLNSNEAKTHQPYLFFNYNYIGKPIIAIDEYSEGGVDFAFIPYSNVERYVAHVVKVGFLDYELTKVYIGMYADYYNIQAYIDHPDQYIVYKTSINSSTTRVILWEMTNCAVIGNGYMLCNYTWGVSIDPFPGCYPIGKGDSGGPVYHCYYNDCWDGDGLIIGISTAGGIINETAGVIVLTNAYVLHYLFSINPYPG